MRKSKKVMFYSMLVCFTFLVAVVVAVCNIKPKVDEQPVNYEVAVEGPSRIEFEYVPGINAGASLYRVYEYAFGNEMDETLRVMLAKDKNAVAENISLGYYISNSKTIINDDFKFSGTLSAVDIPAGGQKWVYIKISADNKDELAAFTRDINWVAGKPVDSYVKVNGQMSTLPSINTGSGTNTNIDYSQALQAPVLAEGEVFGGWYADPFCSEPLNIENITPDTEIYANIYVPSMVTEDDWNAPEVAQTWDGSYKEVLSTNGSTASMYDLGSDGCFWDHDLWDVTERDLYVPAYYKGLPVTDVKLEGLGYYDYVYIPPTVSSLSLSSTFEMSGRNVEIDPENPYYVVIDGKFIVERATKKLINHIGTDTSTVVPDHIEIIGSRAFALEDTSRYITLPDSIIKIEEDAFNCWSLSGTSYGGASYIGSKTNPYMVMIGISDIGLSSIAIHSSTKFINNHSYNYSWNYSLTSLTIPSSVIDIVGVFKGCEDLSRIVVESGNTVYDSRNNCNAIIETATNTLINGCKSTIIPNTVTSIGKDAFYNLNSLTTITIPSSVTSIGDDAFTACNSLTSVDFAPNSQLTSIGDGAFSICSKLTSITIPSSVISIGDGAFSSCDELTSITIPSSVISIGNSAFSSCSSLTSITIPSSVTSIGRYAFSYCSKLTSITFSDTSTWYRTDNATNWANKTGGIQTTVTTPSTNDDYFKSIYQNYYWYKI